MFIIGISIILPLTTSRQSGIVLRQLFLIPPRRSVRQISKIDIRVN